MEEKNLICIGCPMGCPLTVKMEHGEVVSVTGNTCKRGDIYARKEVTNPTRIVTSTHSMFSFPLIAHEYISAAAREENTSCIGSPFSNQ